MYAWCASLSLAAGLFLSSSIILRPARQQDASFNNKVVTLTLSEISATGPSEKTAAFISRSMGLFWPKREELVKTTEPYNLILILPAGSADVEELITLLKSKL